jgi:hypothetical protein
VIERAIKPEELEGFEQCFLTGTAAEVTPVSEIGPYSFTVGEITQNLVNDYMSEVQPKKRCRRIVPAAICKKKAAFPNGSAAFLLW